MNTLKKHVDITLLTECGIRGALKEEFRILVCASGRIWKLLTSLWQNLGIYGRFRGRILTLHVVGTRWELKAL
jgi:hypothetical protein